MSKIRTAILVATALLPSAAFARIEVIPADEVLTRHMVVDKAGARLIVDGRAIELIVDPADPAVSKLGDGAFHPMDASVVEEAIREISSGPLPNARVFVLPYPRRDVLESCCEGDVVFLAPGIRTVAPEHVHATVVHELGHVVENTECPEGSAAWSEYVARRGLEGVRFSRDAIHRDRPQEIFAEDFRFLRGGALATTSGAIENPTLPLPSSVQGLPDFFAQLGGRPPVALRGASVAPLAAPNPFRGSAGESVRIYFSGQHTGSSVTADVFDTLGRRVRSLSGAPSSSGILFRWDGADGAGAQVASGVYFVRCAGLPGTSPARVHILR